MRPDGAGAAGRAPSSASSSRRWRTATRRCGSRISANTLEGRALVYLKSGQIDKAIADYDAALKTNPRLAGALYGRGMAQASQRRSRRRQCRHRRGEGNQPEDRRIVRGLQCAGHARRNGAGRRHGAGCRAASCRDEREARARCAAREAPANRAARAAPAAPPAPPAEITATATRPPRSEPAPSAPARAAAPAPTAAPAPAAAATPPAVAAPAPPPAADCSLAETHWKSAESIGTLAAYSDHLARFPNCVFSTLAAARIEALKK